jgi:hypothetical protein
MNENPLPDLDNDTLTYRFSRAGMSRFVNTIYNIERSINGGNFHIIGTVVKTRDSDWTSSAEWSAEALDKEYRARGDSRKQAVRSLEYRLQGPEYAARKHAEYLREEQERRERKVLAEAEAAKRVVIFDRSSWEQPEIVVTLDGNVVARFFVSFLEGADWNPRTLVRLTKEQARTAADILAESLRRDIRSEAQADVPMHLRQS